MIHISNVDDLLSVSELKSSLVNLSKVSRGKISAMAQKVVDKFNSNRKQISGPYDFSGGVKVYQFGNFLIVSRESEITLEASQISEYFPFLVKTKKDQGLKEVPKPLINSIKLAIKKYDSVGYIFKNPNYEVLYFI